ncbi:serine hydrolase domain-containing protein [Aquipuribacter sp. SD81]|uniref:serine hydrolase domain-containing protein n=1 Tax=Aquipuribacter sp. SD81 TaxID=3127703 RepID=UPI003015D59D
MSRSSPLLPPTSAPVLEPAAVADACAYVDSWWGLRRRHHRVPAVQGAVLLRGELLLESAHGTADADGRVPLTPTHRFRVASHSKTFTAVAVLLLHQRGVLSLEDPVSRWLPAVAGGPVADRTLAELLSHSGGVTRDSTDGDFWQLARAFPDLDGLLAAVAAPADGAPSPAVLGRAERLKYSNIGYGLLGAVVAAASGGTYEAFVRRELVEPLGLARTAPDLDPADPAHADALAEVVTGWSALAYADERVPVDQTGTGALAAATGFASTASDLCRWVAAHHDGGPGPLDDVHRRLMHRTWWQDEGAPEGAQRGGYGYGWQVTEVGARRLVGHGGGWPGHITRTLSDPAAGLAVSVCTDTVDGPALELATGAVRLVDLAAVPPAGALERAAGADLASFAGRWANLWGVRDTVVLGGRLVLLTPGPDPVATAAELDVVDDRTLRVVSGSGYDAIGETWRFERGDDGRVVTVRGSSGMTLWPADGFAARLGGSDARVGRGTLWRTPSAG